MPLFTVAMMSKVELDQMEERKRLAEEKKKKKKKEEEEKIRERIAQESEVYSWRRKLFKVRTTLSSEYIHVF